MNAGNTIVRFMEDALYRGLHRIEHVTRSAGSIFDIAPLALTLEMFVSRLPRAQ